jgi:dephospho-CoA kinase
MSHLLGLTGSIGMGKSTTAQMFREEGVPVWDADATVHRLYGKDGDAVAPIGALYPQAVIDGAVSRDVLKEIIASDPAALDQIERTVHPLVAHDRQAFLDAHDQLLLVFDIPLLFETKADGWLSSVLVVSVPLDIQKARVMSRPGMTEEQFEAILSRQLPDDEKRRRADHVIETFDLDETKAAVRKLIKELTGSIDA